MRIKNEARWIADVIESQLPLVDELYIFDDHSDDDTAQICQSFDKVKFFPSLFEGLDESRDKQWLLDRIISDLPAVEINGDSPYWILAIDGDELLSKEAPNQIRQAVLSGESNVYSLKIRYLWNSRNQIRVDGVYAKFARPSVFRLINPAFKYISTPFGNGANLHCSSIPQEYLGHAKPCEAEILHLGYMQADDRIRKYEWYNRIDPGNAGEDCYRHMVVGDIFTADSKFRYGGPLKLQKL